MRAGGVLIALEGGDGAGKSTQLELLVDRFVSLGREVRSLHFPRFDASVYGELIGDYLRGDFGNMDSLPPKLVGLLYAGDRQSAQGQIAAWLDEGCVVLLDRYYASNLAYQGAKLVDAASREGLIRWLLDLELVQFGIRRADATLYLRVPDVFSRRVLRDRIQEGDGRSYLRGHADIHESSVAFQQRVRAIFSDLGRYIPDYHVVDCGSEGGEGILPPSSVHGLVWGALEGMLGGGAAGERGLFH